jgi:hypothetical protein
MELYRVKDVYILTILQLVILSAAQDLARKEEALQGIKEDGNGRFSGATLRFAYHYCKNAPSLAHVDPFLGRSCAALWMRGVGRVGIPASCSLRFARRIVSHQAGKRSRPSLEGRVAAPPARRG